MKYYSLLFLALSFIAATLGFGLLTGTPAFIARAFFVAFFVLFALALVRRKKVKRPVRGSFATSFQSEV